MATFSFPIPDANYDGGKPAIGTNVRDDTRAIRTWLIGSNIDQDNLADFTDKIQWILTSAGTQAINIQSDVEDTPEFTIRRSANAATGIGDPVNTDRPIFAISSGTNVANPAEQDDVFNVSPDGNKIAPYKSNAERALIATGASLPDGTVIYNTDDQEFQQSINGTTWLSMANVSASITTLNTGSTTNNNAGPNAPSFDHLNLTHVTSGSGILSISCHGSLGTLGNIGITTGAGSPHPRMRFQWLRDIDGGGDVVVSETYIGIDTDTSTAIHAAMYHEFPLSSLNFIDTTVHAKGSSIKYTLRTIVISGIITFTGLNTTILES